MHNTAAMISLDSTRDIPPRGPEPVCNPEYTAEIESLTSKAWNYSLFNTQRYTCIHTHSWAGFPLFNRKQKGTLSDNMHVHQRMCHKCSQKISSCLHCRECGMGVLWQHCIHVHVFHWLINLCASA